MRDTTSSPAPQSRAWSAVEATANTVVSFVIGVAVNMVVLPLLGYPIRAVDSVVLVAVFMVLSFARSYVLRRVFEGVARRRAATGRS